MGPLDIILQPVLEENIRSWKSQKLIQVHDLFSCALTRQVNDGIKIPSLYSQGRISASGETAESLVRVSLHSLHSLYDTLGFKGASGKPASLVRASLHRLHDTLIFESQITVERVYSRNPW